MMKDILTKKEKSFLASREQEALKYYALIFRNKKEKSRHKYIYPIKKADFSKNEARLLGFDYGKKMWKNCSNQEKRNKGGRKKISSILQKNITSHLYNNSEAAANRYLKKCQTNSFYRSLTFREIYENFPEKKRISYSCFRSYIGNQFKKPFRPSDLCGYCENLRVINILIIFDVI